ncbi:MAG: hypothetical protein ACI9D5_002551 [Candidatus Endobugula sp.]|jgi:uncharacterized protein (TIGR02001 family)
MKNLSKSLLASAILAVSATTASVANAELSANVGLVSDYFFRGTDQATGATGSAGIDYASGGFYVGAWAADVDAGGTDDGLEIDGYFGYGFDAGAVSLGLGFTTYQYTGDTFDSEYNELNFTTGIGGFSLEYTVGTREGDTILAITETDYTFTALTYENSGFYGTYGSFGDGSNGDYLELGYGTEAGSFDVGVALVLNDEDLSAGDDDESLVFSLSKTFDI